MTCQNYASKSCSLSIYFALYVNIHNIYSTSCNQQFSYEFFNWDIVGNKDFIGLVIIQSCFMTKCF